MKNVNIQSILAGIAEEAAPSAEIDLWRGIQGRLGSSEPEVRRGEPLLKPNFAQKSFLRRLALATLALVFAFAILFATPQGRAWAQEILRYFNRAASDMLPYTPQPVTWLDVTPDLPAPTITPLPSLAPFAVDCGDFAYARCSIDKVRSKVHFMVSELGSIPAGLYFIGATGGPDRVFIKYEAEAHSGGVYIYESPWTDSPEQTAWQVGASAVVETVQIDKSKGEYVKGSFSLINGQTGLKWNPDLDIQTLHWVEGGIFFEMQVTGSAAQISRDEFVALAETLTTKPVAAASTPMPPTATLDPQAAELSSHYPLTVAQAEVQAGFDLLEPTKLPEFLSWIGARYEAENKTVHLFYHLNLSLSIVPPNDNGLYLSEQLAPDPANGTPWGFRLGDSNALMADNTDSIVGGGIQRVQIGATPGQYVEGAWVADWEPIPDIKRLRWQMNGMAYEMSYIGDDITQADLIAIAESMK
jgi:hypothetical protein